MFCDFMRIGEARILNPRAFNLIRTRNKLFSFERRLSSKTKSETEYNEESLGVYIHWPYCARLCTYCNFNKYVVQKVDQENMVNSLLVEWNTYITNNPNNKIRSIFFGGGTPSLIKPELVEKLIREISGDNVDIEVSLEANPSDVKDSVNDLKLAGLTRLSLGIQSFDDRILKLFNRDHDSITALYSLEQCLTVFGGQVSVDLIFGAPEQSVEDWIQDLQFAIKQGVNHVSTYQLTVERGTKLFKQVKEASLHVPGEHTMAEMYLQAVKLLDLHGLHRYEVSNFGRPGFECKHNIGYWSGVQYLGLGPGAHSRIGLGQARSGRINHPSPEVWLRQVERCGHGVAKETSLDSKTILGELIATGLRTSKGISSKDWDRVSKKTTFYKFIKYLSYVNDSKPLNIDETNTSEVPAKDDIVNDGDDVIYGRGDLHGLVWSHKYLKIKQSHLNIADHIIVNVYSCFIDSLN